VPDRSNGAVRNAVGSGPGLSHRAPKDEVLCGYFGAQWSGYPIPSRAALRRWGANQPGLWARHDRRHRCPVAGNGNYRKIGLPCVPSGRHHLKNMTDWATISVAVGTWAVAGFTWWLVKRQLSIAREQRQIQLYLELRKEFDRRLVDERKLLARQLLSGAAHHEIKETVMNFFEDMGMLLRRDFLDSEMIWDTFSYYARMWWSACKEYLEKEREDVGGDEALFADFDYLVERISQEEARQTGKSRAQLEPSASEMRRFLEAEAALASPKPAF